MIVNDVTQQIDANMKHTLDIVTEGSSSMQLLASQVDTSVQNSVDAASKLETLNHYMEEMHSIVELIGGITSQTSLLALNASIEAARAGEAGKGFAVVAEQIRALSTDTKTSSSEIQSALDRLAVISDKMLSSIGETLSLIQVILKRLHRQAKVSILSHLILLR